MHKKQEISIEVILSLQCLTKRSHFGMCEENETTRLHELLLACQLTQCLPCRDIVCHCVVDMASWISGNKVGKTICNISLSLLRCSFLSFYVVYHTARTILSCIDLFVGLGRSQWFFSLRYRE